MLDARVQDLNVAETAVFNRDGSITHQTRYTYFVAGHGPFTLTYERGADTQQQVEHDIGEQVKKLESLGVLKK